MYDERQGVPCAQSGHRIGARWSIKLGLSRRFWIQPGKRSPEQYAYGRKSSIRPSRFGGSSSVVILQVQEVR